MDQQPSRGFRPSLWPFFPILAAVALCIDFSSFHEHHHGDSIVPILGSLYQWTPFYWEGDRNGWLLPLMACPFKSPLVNLLVQCGLGIFSGVAAYFVLSRYLMKGNAWPVVALLTAAQYVGLVPAGESFEFLCGCQPYFLSLALGVGALVLVDCPSGCNSRWRLFLAFALMVTAHWVNVGLLIALGPLIVLSAFTSAAKIPAGNIGSQRWFAARKFWREMLILSVGAVAGYLFMSLGNQSTDRRQLAFSEWPHSCERLAFELWTRNSPAFWAVSIGLAIAGIVVLAPRRTRIPAANAWRISIALLGAAAVCFLFMSTLHFVRINRFHYRYVFPALVFAQIAAALPIVAALEAIGGRWLGRAAYALALPVLLGAAFVSFGLPGLSEPRAALERSIGSRTNDIVDSQSTHVLGNYFEVWPAVFHANLTLHDQGAERTVWGVTHRSSPTRSGWGSIPREMTRIAVPRSRRNPDEFDADAEIYLRMYFPDSRIVERRATVWILIPSEHAK